MRRVELSVMLLGSKFPLAHLTGFVEQTGTSVTSAPPLQTQTGTSQMGMTDLSNASQQGTPK
jgi:hypothetical protein